MTEWWLIKTTNQLTSEIQQLDMAKFRVDLALLSQTSLHLLALKRITYLLNQISYSGSNSRNLKETLNKAKE